MPLTDEALLGEVALALNTIRLCCREGTPQVLWEPCATLSQQRQQVWHVQHRAVRINHSYT